MGIDFAGDLVEMLSADDHGTTVVHASGEVEGILNSEFLPIDTGGNVDVSGSEPAVYVPTTWAAGVSKGDDLTIGGVSYRVAMAPEDDGTGLSRIALQTV